MMTPVARIQTPETEDTEFPLEAVAPFEAFEAEAEEVSKVPDY